jgi:hypothetical protein
MQEDDERESLGTGARQTKFTAHGHWLAILAAGQKFLVCQRY